MKINRSFAQALLLVLTIIAVCCSEEPATQPYVPPADYWKYQGEENMLSKVVKDLENMPEATSFQTKLAGQPLWKESQSLLLEGTPSILIPVANQKADRIKAVVIVQYKGKKKTIEYELVFRKDLQKKEGPYYHRTRAAWRGYFKALDRTILNKKNNSPGFSIRKLPETEKQNPLSRTTGQVCIEHEYEYCYYTEACTNGECEVTDITCETRYEWICWWEDEECYDECDSNCVNYTGDPCICNNDCGGDEPCYDECNPACVNYNGGCSSPEPTDILNHVVDPCLNSLTANLAARSAFLNYMFGNSPNFDMEFADAPLPIGVDHNFATTGKQTGANGYFKIVTTLNSQSLPNASQEFITATLIHEMYHTYMLLMDPAHSSNEDSHDFMAQPDVIQEMAQMLRQMHPSLDVQTSIDLTWGGLEGTDAFNNLPVADRNRINTANNDHQRAAHGTPCP